MPCRAQQLLDLGQSVWLDYIHRRELHSGVFAAQVRDQGVVGVTSNPTIFQQAIGQGSDYDAAIREFENVLSLPENEQLVYKQFSVAFTNLGHAYYEKGNALVAKDKEAAAQNFAKAIRNLQRAKQNTRFFPTMRYDEAVHDTYYYTALSFHKLYLITMKASMMNDANLAWREYFDFYPQKLEGKAAYEQSREAGKKYWDQIKSKM